MRDAIDREDAPAAEGGWLTWLADCGVPGITGVDTRALVRHIRDKGSMRGGIFPGDTPEADAHAAIEAEPSMSGRDLACEVTPAEPVVLEGDGPRVIAIDTGIKGSIIRNLQRARRAPRAAPLPHERRGPAGAQPRRRLPRQRPGRPGRARLRRRDRARARRQGAGDRHLPRPPAAVPGGRARDLQAAVRPPRREPPGQGPRDGQDRHHAPEPRLRGARPERRAAIETDEPRALGDRLRRGRAVAR